MQQVVATRQHRVWDVDRHAKVHRLLAVVLEHEASLLVGEELDAGAERVLGDRVGRAGALQPEVGRHSRPVAGGRRIDRHGVAGLPGGVHLDRRHVVERAGLHLAIPGRVGRCDPRRRGPERAIHHRLAGQADARSLLCDRILAQAERVGSREVGVKGLCVVEEVSALHASVCPADVADLVAWLLQVPGGAQVEPEALIFALARLLQGRATVARVRAGGEGKGVAGDGKVERRWVRLREALHHRGRDGANQALGRLEHGRVAHRDRDHAAERQAGGEVVRHRPHVGHAAVGVGRGKVQRGACDGGRARPHDVGALVAADGQLVDAAGGPHVVLEEAARLGPALVGGVRLAEAAGGGHHVVGVDRALFSNAVRAAVVIRGDGQVDAALQRRQPRQHCGHRGHERVAVDGLLDAVAALLLAHSAVVEVVVVVVVGELRAARVVVVVAVDALGRVRQVSAQLAAAEAGRHQVAAVVGRAVGGVDVVELSDRERLLEACSGRVQAAAASVAAVGDARVSVEAARVVGAVARRVGVGHGAHGQAALGDAVEAFLQEGVVVVGPIAVVHVVVVAERGELAVVVVVQRGRVARAAAHVAVVVAADHVRVLVVLLVAVELAAALLAPELHRVEGDRGARIRRGHRVEHVVQRHVEEERLLQLARGRLYVVAVRGGAGATQRALRLAARPPLRRHAPLLEDLAAHRDAAQEGHVHQVARVGHSPDACAPYVLYAQRGLSVCRRDLLVGHAGLHALEAVERAVSGAIGDPCSARHLLVVWAGRGERGLCSGAAQQQQQRHEGDKRQSAPGARHGHAAQP